MTLFHDKIRVGVLHVFFYLSEHFVESGSHHLQLNTTRNFNEWRFHFTVGTNHGDQRSGM